MAELPTDGAEFFREVTLRLCSSLDLEVALHRSLNALGERIPVDEIWANVIDFTTWTLQPVAMANRSGGRVFGEDGPRVPLSEASRAELKSIPIDIVQRLDDPADDSVAKDVGNRYGSSGGSLLNLRLSLEGQRVGAITLRSHRSGAFSNAHERLLLALREPFAVALSNFARHREVLRLKDLLAEDNSYLNQELVRLSGNEIVGAEQGLKGVLDQVSRVAPTSSPVLLLGETGCGKEVVTNAVHRNSPRCAGPLIKVNCGAIPETLIDSELFGHEKGAFTGATERKRGLFERANGGTLFLDEVGELPASAQVRLLRALQEKEIQRVGGNDVVRLDLRIVAATHRDLRAMVQQKSFREDLWFRLSVFPIEIPPLRQRRSDIPALVNYLLQRKGQEMGLAKPARINKANMAVLVAYDWPGNVRELSNVIERALILSGGEPLRFDHLLPGAKQPLAKTPEPKRTTAAEAAPLGTLEEIDAVHIRKVLDSVQGRIEGAGGAAEILGLNSSTLRHRMRKLHIEFGRVRAE